MFPWSLSGEISGRISFCKTNGASNPTRLPIAGGNPKGHPPETKAAAHQPGEIPRGIPRTQSGCPPAGGNPKGGRNRIPEAKNLSLPLLAAFFGSFLPTREEMNKEKKIPRKQSQEKPTPAKRFLGVIGGILSRSPLKHPPKAIPRKTNPSQKVLGGHRGRSSKKPPKAFPPKPTRLPIAGGVCHVKKGFPGEALLLMPSWLG